nr:alpha/beta hydrolase fold-1 [Tanacetum cinerariifolium]
MDLIRASEIKTSPYDWTNLSPNSSSCWTTSWSSSSRSNSETESSKPVTNDGNAGKLRLIMLYVFGLFVVAFEYIKRGIIRLKPVRVGPALT